MQSRAWRRADITYCSNVHPGEEAADVTRIVSDCVGGVRELRNLGEMSSGLWLSDQAVTSFANDRAEYRVFSEALRESGISLLTLNGFPYGGFHQQSVKEAVYQPDWTDQRRLDYTLKLANLLADLLPEDRQRGTISTLPLGLASGWDVERQQRAENLLCTLAGQLSQLREDTGRSIMLCLEMEPGCVLEATDQLLDLFNSRLPEAARRTGTPLELIQGHIGICFDVCHQAVMFEDPVDALSRITAAGIAIGKIQVSSALELKSPAKQASRDELNRFVEPRYVHQVRTQGATGDLAGVMDLPEAFDPLVLSRDRPWRVHFHVPIQYNPVGGERLTTTQFAILEVLDFLRDNPACRPLLEVETYTWEVLPGDMRPDSQPHLLEGIARELEWLECRLEERGLLEH